MPKPTVLLIGPLVHCNESWYHLGTKYELKEFREGTRPEFIARCKTGEYNNVVGLYRSNMSISETGSFDQEMVDELPRSLKYICHNGAGYDNIDVEASDVGIFLMLGALRQAQKPLEAIRAGQWRGNTALGHDPKGKVLGILGMGGIGRLEAMAHRARAFGCKIIYHNRARLPAKLEGDARYVSFDELLAHSDILSLNLALNAATRHIISEREFAKMKDGVVIVNTARGALINEKDLVAALNSGKVASAGLDVFEHEPQLDQGLIQSKKAFILPHIGTNTYETQRAMELLVLQNLESAVDGKGLLTQIAEQKAKVAMHSKEDPLTVLYTHYVNLGRSGLRRTPTSVKYAATLALLLSIISSSYGSYRWWRARRKEKAIGRQLVRMNSGIRAKDGTRIIYVPKGDTTSRVIIHPVRATTFDAHRRLFLAPPRVTRIGSGTSTPAYGPSTQVKAGLNLAFLHQFLSLLNIMIPRFRCKETALLFSHGVFLIMRTYLSLVVARLDGAIVRDLVSGQGKAFLVGIVRWLAVGTLASYTNAMIKFLQSKISIAFRTRLTRYIHDLYLNANLNYYKLINLDGGVGDNPDQFITQDLTLFCTAAASLYSSLGKPLVDLFVFNYQLYRSLGPLALSGLLANYFATATLLRRVSPPFGKLKAVEGKKEGDFRALHARLIANAEEVGFYGGAEMEKVYLNKSFKELRSWMEGIYGVKVRYNMLEDFVLKYSWSAFGYIITAIPVYLPAWAGSIAAGPVSDNQADSQAAGLNRECGHMKEFVTNKRLMLSLADAGGRMMYSIKDLSELAGYTSRVYQLISTLHRVQANAYSSLARRSPGKIELFSLADVQGTVYPGFDGIRMEDVPIVAPSLYPHGGDELIESLSFVVHSGEHLLVSGANGVGKSSIARIVAGLWPVYRGLVSRPRNTGQDGIMFLPQRPYLSVGTLRDQVIYPHTEMDMREAGKRDIDLEHILESAKLAHLLPREGGWDTRKEWKDVLSGGEKQRMAIARLLYHEPRYAFLDEATSAVSNDVEGILYETAKDRGITLVTISTRASLRKYHTYNLILGLGEEGYDWEMVKIGSDQEKQGVEKELEELRERLVQVEAWKRRKAEIDQELGHVLLKDGQELPAPSYGAVIKALLAHPPPFEHQILALTRNPSSAKAQSLDANDNIKVIEGDLNNSAAIFEKAGGPASIWGAFLVTVPGKAKKDELGEEGGGKSLVDAAVANGVKHLVFSSVDRGGPGVSDTNPTSIAHFASKHKIELYLKDKAKDTNMTYTILRPVAFMDNLGPSTFGGLFSVMWRGVGDKPLQLVATKDIGVFGAQAFASHDSDQYKNSALSLAGDELNHKEAAEIFSKTIGRPMPESYWFLGAVLQTVVREVGVMFTWFKDVGFGADASLCRKLNPALLNFDAYLKEESGFKH
ncbi:hypothetical protein DV736_g5409, partial [Chaetothyriales sp. CBS 134916]